MTEIAKQDIEFIIQIFEENYDSGELIKGDINEMPEIRELVERLKEAL